MCLRFFFLKIFLALLYKSKSQINFQKKLKITITLKAKLKSDGILFVFINYLASIGFS